MSDTFMEKVRERIGTRLEARGIRHRELEAFRQGAEGFLTRLGAEDGVREIFGPMRGGIGTSDSAPGLLGGMCASYGEKDGVRLALDVAVRWKTPSGQPEVVFEAVANHPGGSGGEGRLTEIRTVGPLPLSEHAALLEQAETLVADLTALVADKDTKAALSLLRR